MKASEIKFWQDTIKMTERAHNKRVENWRELKKRLTLDFKIDGVEKPVVVSRFFPIVREIIASVAFRYPHIFIKTEEDPADPETGQVLADATAILEDFANDAVEMMRVKPKMQRVIFDALFCFRGWLKIGLAPENGLVAPYFGSDANPEDFTVIQRVPPEYILTDPLCPSEDFYGSRFVIEKMFPPLDQIIVDERFEKFSTQLKGLKDRGGKSTVKPDDVMGGEHKDEDVNETLAEAHKLANTRKVYEIHDRIGQRRIVFIDGIEQPIEEVEHPFVTSVVKTRRDPLTGRPLLALADETTGTAGVRARKKFLIEGGLPYFSLAFDVADEFYGDPLMAYENPIQNAIIKSITRRMQIQERYKRLVKIKKQEVEENPELVDRLKTAQDGDGIELKDLDAMQEINWGTVPVDQLRIESDMLRYENEIIRTTSNNESDTATEAAIKASQSELNRNFAQDPVEQAYVWVVRNTFSILSDERFEPQNHELRTSQQGGDRINLALKSWHLKGRYNINIAAGSMNVLFEQMNRDKIMALAGALRQSPNVDQLALDRRLIRAFGEVDPESLLKDEANTDAAKAAELEVQIMMSMQHDPGVNQGEDHDTHIKFQHPNVIQQHPQFAQLIPAQKQAVLQIATQHYQAHVQLRQQETGNFAFSRGGDSGRTKNIISQVRSNAQQTARAVEAEVADT